MSTKTQAAVEDLYRIPDRRRGDEAAAAIHGWTMPVDELFD